jgi:RNA polymerase sigma-70 factor (ECF subfamily)
VEQCEERALVGRIMAGDQTACAQLIREHHASIYRLLAHLCRDTHQAEDLVQETFAAAWAGIGGFGGASSLRTWLYRIAYRKFLDSQRQRAVAIDAVIGNSAFDAAGSAAGPVALAMAGEDSTRLYLAIAELPEDERDVVVMHYLQGMKYEEIAVVLEVPAGTLRWRKGRALESLRRLLGEKATYEVE